MAYTVQRTQPNREIFIYYSTLVAIQAVMKYINKIEKLTLYMEFL